MNLKFNNSLVLLAAIHGTTAFAQQITDTQPFDVKQITGSWDGTDNKGETATFQFQPGGYAQVTYHGERLVPAIPNGPTLRFEINSSKSPMWLDFVARDPSGKELGRIKFIFRMVSPKEMKVRAGADLSSRPEEFNDADLESTITFKKVY